LCTSVQRRTHVLGKSVMKTDMKRATRLFGIHTNSDGGSVRASEIPNTSLRRGKDLGAVWLCGTLQPLFP
jgi:hypothetical protein